MTKYVHFPNRPKKLTAEFAKEHYDQLVSRINEAEKAAKPDKWIKLFRDWNDLGSYIGGEASRIHYTYTKDMRSAKSEAADKYFREKIGPAITDAEHTLVKAFLDSKHRDAMAAEFGKQLIPDFEQALKPIDPINIDLAVKTGNLGAEFDSLQAKAMVTVNGEKMTLLKARALVTGENEPKRKAAWLARGDWALKNHAKMAEIYDKLVKLRDQMGKNVGYENYIPLAYENRGRQGYGQAEVEAFRQAVKKYMVPLRDTLMARQAADLGKPQLQPWDGYDPATTLPLGIVPISIQLDAAQRLFDKLDPRLAKHFADMRKAGWIDLENRPGKKLNAYMTSMSDENKAIVFCNSTGDPDDVSTLIHEMGHAFQTLESQWIEAVDLQHPSLELCEVHSMGMEFLSLPLITEFFSKEHAAKHRLGRWKDSVYLLCYVSVVDEFQHWVYENPKASAKQRDEKWQELSDYYCPGINMTGYEKYNATRWYFQQHIFLSPFYYIDYALAETGAMQLGMLDALDHQKALDTYMNLCHVGGTESFLEAFKVAGLRSPFDENLMSDLADYASKELSV